MLTFVMLQPFNVWNFCLKMDLIIHFDNSIIKKELKIMILSIDYKTIHCSSHCNPILSCEHIHIGYKFKHELLKATSAHILQCLLATK